MQYTDAIAIQEADSLVFTADGVSYQIEMADNITINDSVRISHADSIIVGDHLIAANAENIMNSLA